jgi:ferredoxin
MRIEVDPDVCIGSGMCALTDPDVFDQSEEDGTVVLLDGQPARDHQERARQAQRLCPSGAIRVLEGR